MSEPTFPEAFVVQRDEDVSGVSGEGIVAEGVRFSDGWVATHWLDQPPMHEPKTEVWHNPGTAPFEKISGHGGRTRILWAADVAAARCDSLADIAEAFAVPAQLLGPEGERAYLHRQLTRALTAEHQRRAREKLVCSPEDHCAGFADAAMPVLEQLLKQRDRVWSATSRAYALAGRWLAAHGSSSFLVRAAGAELRDTLDESAADPSEVVHPTGSVQASEPRRVGDSTEAAPCDAYEPPMCADDSGYCARCGMLDYKHAHANTAAKDRAAAAECSALHTRFTPARECIRAAQHRGDHIDDSGFHWSDTVAVYPVVVGEPRFAHGVPDCSNPDHVCNTCGDCLYEHPGEGGCPKLDSGADIRADNYGPTTPNQQVNEGESAESEPDTVTDPAWLRAQYRAAIREVLGEGPWAVVTYRAADAVVRVRDGEMNRLRQRLELADATLRDYTEADSEDAAAGSYADRAKRAEGERDKALAAFNSTVLDLEDAQRALAEARQLVSMMGELIGAERRIVSTAMGHRDDQGVRVEACDGCGRDHMAELDKEIREADRAYAAVFPSTADGPARPGRLPENAARTPRLRAYEAVTAYIESLGHHLPTTRSARTAHIWLAVNRALEAAGHPADPETLCRLPHDMEA